MKTFICNVYKNKKWITLGLSILYLVLFCFPIKTMTKIIDMENLEFKYYQLPFILYLPIFIFSLNTYIKTFYSFTEHGVAYRSLAYNFSIDFFCSLFMLLSFIIAIICVIRFFRGKKCIFAVSLVFAFLTMFTKSIRLNLSDYTSCFIKFYPTTYIFLTLLVLDIVYLILERYYVTGIDKRTARKPAKQAQAEAEYKQSPEYRIEQLEKRVQELQAQVKDDDQK